MPGLGSPEPEVLLAALLVAVLIDAVVGGPRLLGRIPGPDSIFRLISEILFGLLGSAARPAVRARLMGAPITTFSVILAAGTGYVFDALLWSHPGVVAAKIFLLALFIGQRTAIVTAILLARRLNETKNYEAEGRFAAARWGLERLSHRFADGLVSNTIIFLAGGFTGLLMFRALSVVIAVGSPKGILRPADNLLWFAGWLYGIMSIVPAVTAALALLFAGLLTFPRRLLRGLRFDRVLACGPILPIRAFPLAVLCSALGVVLKAQPDESERSGEFWVGAEGGRARALSEDVKAGVWVTLLASVIFLLSVVGVWLALMSPELWG